MKNAPKILSVWMIVFLLVLLGGSVAGYFIVQRVFELRSPMEAAAAAAAPSDAEAPDRAPVADFSHVRNPDLRAIHETAEALRADIAEPGDEAIVDDLLREADDAERTGSPARLRLIRTKLADLQATVGAECTVVADLNAGLPVAVSNTDGTVTIAATCRNKDRQPNPAVSSSITLAVSPVVSDVAYKKVAATGPEIGWVLGEKRPGSLRIRWLVENEK